MRVNVETGLIAAWALIERCVVTGKADTGANTAIKSPRLDPRKCPSLGLEYMFGMKLRNFRPRFLDHGIVFVAELGTNHKRECPADCKLKV